jgi:N-glycosylase/DNA lyase
VAKGYGRQILPTVDLLDGSAGPFRTVPGEPLSPFSFPSPGDILSCGRICMSSCSLGYREKYLWDTAGIMATGDIAREDLLEMEQEEAEAFLTALPGVGQKVADCVMLFSLGHGRTFPTDVWIQRAANELYRKKRRKKGKGMTPTEARKWGCEVWGKDAGYAQQYLYYFMREGQGRGPSAN